ncbi:MAG: PilN domain-containing protein [Gemmatimonadota bacterium]
MITINLRPGQKRKRGGSSGKQFVDRLKELGAAVKDPLLIGAAAAWVLVIGFLAFSFITTNRSYAALQPRLEQAQEEHKRFHSLLQQKKRSEMIRDSLLRQIGVIRNVDGDRYVWPHIMDEVAKALPSYTWLTDMSTMTSAAPVDTADTTSKPMEFQLVGRTVDIQAYTKFLRQLEASPWIQNVTPLEAKTLVEQERPVTGFTIHATFKKADSAYVRTVPLSQSVR